MSDRRKILIVTSSLDAGGAENHILNLCRYLLSVSCVPEVLTISDRRTPIRDALTGEGVRVDVFPLRSLSGLLRPGMLPSLKRAVMKADPDILHAHLYHGEVIASLASLLTGVPMVATRHSCGLEFGGARKWIVRLMAGRYSGVIAVSGEAAGEAAGLGIGKGRIEKIPNGVDTERFSPMDPAGRAQTGKEFRKRHFGPQGEQTGLLIGTLGGLKKVKNLPLFIRMVPEVLAGWKDAAPLPWFVISGEGPEREELESLSLSLGLESRVAIPGFVADPENLLPLLDVFIMPSISEGAPMALLEAMACGVACVASDVGEISAIVGDAGLVIDPRHHEGFASAVLRLASDEPLRRALGEKARLRAVSNYGLAAWGAATLGVYEKITGLKF